VKIENLRRIGRQLSLEITGAGRSPDMQKPLGVGAGGDRTFPIDKRAEDIILSGLGSLGEPLTVVSEEAGVLDIQGGGPPIVIIDPIDGSKNAVSGIPVYCASIAVASGNTVGDIELSYVINLVNGDEFWAERHSGAFLNGQRIFTQKDTEFILVAYEAQSPVKDLPVILPLLSRARKTRCLGSIALDLSYLSLGAISVFVSPSASRSFDFAGGLLLVREAGGLVTDTEGGDVGQVMLGLKRSCPLLASANEGLHRKALDLLSGREKRV